MTRRGFTSAVAGACSLLVLFNTHGPRDPARRAGRDIASGPDPRQTLDVYALDTRSGAPLPDLDFFYGGSAFMPRAEVRVRSSPGADRRSAPESQPDRANGHLDRLE